MLVTVIKTTVKTYKVPVGEISCPSIAIRDAEASISAIFPSVEEYTSYKLELIAPETKQKT